MNNKVFIIAEAGSNHNGSLKQAKKLIKIAKKAGSDAVKFQVFRAKTMYPRKQIEVKYLKNIGIKEGLYEIIEKFEVPYEWIKELSTYAKLNDIEFMATPFDLETVKILNPFVNIFKIASYECMYLDLISAVKKTGKELYISTGACTEDEVDLIVKEVLSDYLDRTVLLHCIAKYPAPLEEINLNIIPHFAKKYRIRVGYSDHTLYPYIAPIIAVTLGARVIEKHFTLSRKLLGPDHRFAVEPDELREMVKAIRLTEGALVDGNKRVLQNCEKELYYYKRCLYFSRDIRKGEKIKKSDLIVLRNTGTKCSYINPIRINKVIGKTLTKDRNAGNLVRQNDIR